MDQIGFAGDSITQSGQIPLVRGFGYVLSGVSKGTRCTVHFILKVQAQRVMNSPLGKVAQGMDHFMINPLSGLSTKAKANYEFTAIGRMDTLKNFDNVHNVDTWRKSGPSVLPGKTRVTWPQNRKWLDEKIARGDTFIMTINPKDLPTEYIDRVPNGWFTKLEYDYLLKKGAKIEYEY